MYAFYRAILNSFFLLSVSIGVLYASCEKCCDNMGGIQYCDSSGGRYVCKNGEYSSCYCTRHAIMELQKIEGCCLWQGGVLKIDGKGAVICRNGSISEICTLQKPVDQ